MCPIPLYGHHTPKCTPRDLKSEEPGFPLIDNKRRNNRSTVTNLLSDRAGSWLACAHLSLARAVSRTPHLL